MKDENRNIKRKVRSQAKNSCIGAKGDGMITMVLDTNEYGWYLDYTIEGKRNEEAVNSFNLVSRLLEEKQKDGPKVTVYSTETVGEEIKSAGKPSLDNVFDSLVTGVIKNSKRVEELGNEFYNECRKEGLSFVTINDCEIIAATVIGNMTFLVTENRKTLNNRKVIEVLSVICKRKNLRLPKICDSKKAYCEIYA